MKDCENCKYCNGFDYDDGTPNCTCEGGMDEAIVITHWMPFPEPPKGELK